MNYSYADAYQLFEDELRKLANGPAPDSVRRVWKAIWDMPLDSLQGWLLMNRERISPAIGEAVMEEFRQYVFTLRDSQEGLECADMLMQTFATGTLERLETVKTKLLELE